MRECLLEVNSIVFCRQSFFSLVAHASFATKLRYVCSQDRILWHVMSYAWQRWLYFSSHRLHLQSFPTTPSIHSTMFSNSYEMAIVKSEEEKKKNNRNCIFTHKKRRFIFLFLVRVVAKGSLPFSNLALTRLCISLSLDLN